MPRRPIMPAPSDPDPLPNDDLICLNGIDGATGNYLTPPLSPVQAAALARGHPQNLETGGLLRRIWKVLTSPFMGLPIGVNPTDVAQAGWAVVFAHDVSRQVRDALAPLVRSRRRQVPPDRCKELEYRPGEAVKDWLKRYGTAHGSVDPRKVPYYLLLVGEPAAIPFEFQYLLDVEYAVGRLCFDVPGEYARYADSVVEYETAGAVPNGREVVYWGTRHAADRATQLSADYLIAPLSEGKTAAGRPADDLPIADELGYRRRLFRGHDASKANLGDVLHGRPATPAFLFTASHGMGWSRGHPEQWGSQGALLCQDWSGFGSVKPG